MTRNFLSALVFCTAVCAASGSTNGIYNDSPAARGMSLGGAETAAAQSPLEAMSANPAALGYLARPAAEAGLVTGLVDGEFRDHANPRGAAFSDAGVTPTGAIVFPWGIVHIGLGIYYQSALRADWKYRDGAGGADGLTSYGVRTQRSQILLLRTALGFALKIDEKLSIGASIGLLENRNQLYAPYVFQSQPILRGAKTLLDLETSGWGCNVQAGILWRPIDQVRFGLVYTSSATVHTSGIATGNANVQLKNLGLGGARSDFAYDADVTNRFPQELSLGGYWKAASRLGITAQADWLNWQGSFDTLGVRLRHGNNADLNALVGASSLNDTIPLDWHDQFVFRFGAEYLLAADWSLRAGYSYSPNPVPGATLTPLNAAISEHTVGAGLGFHHGPYTVDLSYQWALPITAHVGRSSLLSGEYSNSSVEVSTQWLAMTAGVQF